MAEVNESLMELAIQLHLEAQVWLEQRALQELARNQEFPVEHRHLVCLAK